MAAPKGNNYSKGRPKGSANKETKRIREWIATFLDENTQTLQDDILKMEGKERVNSMLQLMEYAVPKLARTELVGDDGNEFTINVITHSQKDGQ